LPPLQFPRDVRNLTTLATLTPLPDYRILYSHTNEMTTPPSLHETTNPTSSSRTSRVLSLHQSDLSECLQKRRQDNHHTTLWIQQDDYKKDRAAVSLANHVASIIDELGGNGCDYIWLSVQDDFDQLLRVCEELIYLDVAGPTIKSRMVLDAWKDDEDDDEVVEEAMWAGVNKFVIHDVSQVERIEILASEQGKRIDQIKRKVGRGIQH
jgi:hypothetical protein